jgi:hypothetical protein
VLWECVAIAEGCHVFIGAIRVSVVCALHLVASDLRRHCPALVMACPYVRGGCWPPVMTGSQVT